MSISHFGKGVDGAFFQVDPDSDMSVLVLALAKSLVSIKSGMQSRSQLCVPVYIEYQPGGLCLRLHHVGQCPELIHDGIDTAWIIGVL